MFSMCSIEKEAMKKTAGKGKLEIMGVGASPGIAIGRVHVLKSHAFTLTGVTLKSEQEVLTELNKFERAVQASVEDIETIKGGLSDEQAIHILDTQIEFLTDPQIKIDVVERISKVRENAIDAVIEIIEQSVDILKGLGSEYMSERASDLRDAGRRILGNLHTVRESQLSFESNTIIIAEDISPSEVMGLDLKKVTAFATQVGGRTSHTAILARLKGVPAVLSCGPRLSDVQNGDEIIVDGKEGLVIIGPDKYCIEEYQERKAAHDLQMRLMRELKDIPARTSDNKRVGLFANISSADDMREALEWGAEGAGLLRTELLFMDRNIAPSEDEQFEFYKQVALRSKGNPVVVRTLDVGGDKPAKYLGIHGESNPFLGYRGIRISLQEADIFKEQLRAILRASTLGNLKIMFPMISNLTELRTAKAILEEAKVELAKRQTPFDIHIKTGMMIEVPSAAIMAGVLAREVDFFSIGTNDLCQYTLAVDRGNEKVRHLYDLYDPAFLRLIDQVIKQGIKNNIEVAMCGELASDPLATPLLIGMGLEEFSMTASSIPLIKKKIIDHSYSKAKEIYTNVMSMDDSKSITDFLQGK